MKNFNEGFEKGFVDGLVKSFTNNYTEIPSISEAEITRSLALEIISDHKDQLPIAYEIFSNLNKFRGYCVVRMIAHNIGIKCLKEYIDALIAAYIEIINLEGGDVNLAMQGVMYYMDSLERAIHNLNEEVNA